MRLQPTRTPCSAQEGIYAGRARRIKGYAPGFERKLRLPGEVMAQTDGKHVVVTGAGTGIGLAIVRRSRAMARV